MFEVFLEVIILFSHRSQRALMASNLVKRVHRMLRFADLHVPPRLISKLELLVELDSITEVAVVEELEAIVEITSNQRPLTQ